MKRIIQLISVWLLALMSPNGVLAQTANTWTGATDTDWNTTSNWDQGHAPTDTEVAIFDLTASLTITAASAISAPAGMMVTSDVSDGSKALTLGVDITVGTGNLVDYEVSAMDGALQISANGKLIVPAGVTLTGTPAGSDASAIINLLGELNVSGTVAFPATNGGDKHAIRMNGATNKLVVTDGGIFDIDAAKIGIFCNSGATFAYTDGPHILIETGGTLDMSGHTGRGAVLDGAAGGIEVENNGTFNITHNDGTNSAMRIKHGTLTNNASGVFTVTRTAATLQSLELRAATASAVNYGTMSFTGGVAFNNVDVRGPFTNEAGGVIILEGDNQIRLNSAADAVFTNNGFVKTTGNGFLSNNGTDNGTCINNGFYKFGDGIAWPNTGNGANNVDNGIRLFTLPGSFNADAQDASPFNITLKAAHNWYTESTADNQVAATDATGSTTLSTEDCVTTFYTSYGEEVKMTLTNSPNCDHTITFGALANKTFGDAPFEVSATSDQGLTVQFSVVSGPIEISGTTVTITGAGTAEVAADQPGDETYPAAPQVTQTFEIAKANQTITVEAIADKLVTDAAFDVVASTTSGLELTYEIEGKATISGKTVTLTGEAGIGRVTVSQAGNENYNAAEEVAVTFTIEEVAVTLAAEDLSTKPLAVYPNPTADVINLDIPLSKPGAYAVRILEMNGAVVLKKQLTVETKQQLSVAHLERGLYLIEVSNGDEKNISKLVISDQ